MCRGVAEKLRSRSLRSIRPHLHLDEGRRAVTENMSFDRMRNMLTRAAEIRESEQQQIFDALDEIHARMSPLESMGSVRKRLSELPDRTELGQVSERGLGCGCCQGDCLVSSESLRSP